MLLKEELHVKHSNYKIDQLTTAGGAEFLLQVGSEVCHPSVTISVTIVNQQEMGVVCIE